MEETNPINEDYDGVNVEDEKIIVSENVKSDEDIVRCNVKVTRKFLNDYNALCKKKGMTRSKRLRNFMEFELRKETEKVAAEEKAKLEAQTKTEAIFDPFADHSNDGFEKPKGLNTSVSEN
jgi:hypothetical protein